LVNKPFNLRKGYKAWLLFENIIWHGHWGICFKTCRMGLSHLEGDHKKNRGTVILKCCITNAFDGTKDDILHNFDIDC
jgi:hypothetical protein